MALSALCRDESFTTLGKDLAGNENLPRKAVRVREVLAHASDTTLIPMADLVGKSRFREHCYARFAICMVANENGRSLSEIGRVLNRDHTTVLHAVRQGKELEARGGNFAALVRNVRLRATGVDQPRIWQPSAKRALKLPTIKAAMDTGQRDQVNRHRGSMLLAHALVEARHG